MRARLQGALAVRLGVAFVLLGGTIALEGGAPAGVDPLFQIVLGVFSSSIAVSIWIGARPARAEPPAYTLIAIDLALTSALVYVTGGAQSGFSFLFGVATLSASVVVGPRPTLVVAGLAPLLFACVALGVASGLLPPPTHAVMVGAPLGSRDFALALLRNIVGLLLVGGLAAVLSERLHRTAGALVRATETAAEQQRLTEDIVRSLGSGLITAGLDDVVRTVNESGARILGRASEAIVSVSIGSLFDALAPGEQARGEATARKGDGETIPIGYSRTPLVAHDGEVRGSLLLFQDLTEITTLRAKAERAERLAALGQIAAGMAHEIRNPLGAISGSVELVRDTPGLGAEDAKLLATVLTEVDRVNELVTSMLELGRPSIPERRRHDLAVIARDVVELAKRQAGGVTLTIDAIEAFASLDPSQIRQVAWNLVKNAMQFSPKDGTVSVQVASDGTRATMSVEDRGAGISEADQKRVFEPFFSKRKHGVGLGLAIAKQIVEAHGGTIAVDSEPGRTRFVLTLDATTRTSSTPPSQASS
jgi:two-component system sensor histidine kinase PilS (NtrC family)